MKLTKYEKARIIGARALQLSMGAPLLLKLGKSELTGLNYNPIKIAMLEFEKGILPITIKRPMP
ncbi:DNA-directed RNA polymerase subunit K [Candidatus Woesearchaeota archaeon]|jgi:DNA-directed RNA polymerase subunit K/omega|nr:DNA-directed RNA polymerase subunit K [Candidatus Woesearchaeota archaeon]MBT4321638.1 DNA-directed RNA polymerase subunit K [Candidatus Woesearchaeota archaeon]MBT4631051.1 DNA-directed RNA polymerase subunit K [Candidatus Woesearchaeota archaeon]